MWFSRGLVFAGALTAHSTGVMDLDSIFKGVHGAWYMGGILHDKRRIQ